ncbi:MAG: HAD family hydrolase [Pseudomonadota bacterium]
MHDTILPADLPRALERVGDDTKVLSLDCFDTLIWRDCHGPTDVFRGMGSVTHGQRVAAQTTSRHAKRAQKDSVEVSLADIYAAAMPGAPCDAIEAAIQEELDTETATCFAFAPAVDLIRAAKAKGLRVIIVSDTFLTAQQLRALIERVAGEEVATMIDRVFASCEVGLSKAQGLLGKVPKAMKCRPTEILHIGDNPKADLEGARAVGTPALHMVQFSSSAQQRLRLERACSEVLGYPAAGVEGLQPHRAQIALHEPATKDPAHRLGFTVLGPITYAYDQWLRAEAAALTRERGGQVHWLFMLRDAHLSHCVHCASGEANSAARIGISRVVASGAALASRNVYRHQRAQYLSVEPDRFARQMLFTEDEINAIVGDPKTDVAKAQAREKVFAELRSGKREKTTMRRARALADRLIAHIRAECDPQSGDTLMLIDLGYDGSTQNAISSLLGEAFDCHVAGRYMLLREMTVSGLDKKGLIDARDLGTSMVLGLTRNSALLEQLSTCDMGSVIDYTASGQPVHKVSPVNPRQSAMREAVQDGCVAFAKAMQASPIIRQAEPAHGKRAWREAAASAIMRLMFLPMPEELEILGSFEHDFNFGAEHMVALFDNDSARDGLRRRGLFYLKGVERMYLPAELAAEPIEARLALLVQSVKRLGLTYADTMGEALELEAVHFDANQSRVQRVAANTTYEGFYVLRLPLPVHGQGLAIKFGDQFELVEFGSITRSSVASLNGWTGQAPERVDVLFDGMREIAPSVVSCEGEEAVLVIPSVLREPSQDAQMVEIVFRPLRVRGAPVPALAVKAQPHAKTAAAA